MALRNGTYAGLIRVAPVPRRAPIGLLAVRADQHRQGVGRALLTHALGELHRAVTDPAWGDVDASNTAAITMFERVGARRAGSNIEPVRH
ncbi:GNAT family N-acetyltransferase [Streptomyces sp. NPDC048603]|uniref:GNAT family N-acetyltransferase n=1 Tax=Streptomyces sp. NPDC048603 TaxID=3365577 RepID=UPI00371A46F1